MSGLGLIFIGGSMLIAGGKTYQLTHHLKSVGVKTQAVIHAVEKPDISVRLSIETFSYIRSTRTTVCFQDSEEKWLAARLKGSGLLAYKVGDRLNVIYDPSCLDDCVLDDGTSTVLSSVVLLLLGLGVSGYGLYQFLLT